MRTEKNWKRLFDYQKFEQNARLQKLIRETENRYGQELSDDSLALVNAAGEPELGKDNGGGVNPYTDSTFH